MGPADFAALEGRVFAAICPTDSGVSDIVAVLGPDGTGYLRSDVKAAILSLKARGLVRVDDYGRITKTQT